MSAERITDVLGTVGSGPLYLGGTPGGVTYFSAGPNQLWKSDGTDAGTVMLKDFGASGGFDPREMTVLGGEVLFSGGTASGGRELWKTDGTAEGTVQVKDIRSGTASSLVQRLTVSGDRVYFIADNGANGFELWRSDGTGAGTTLVKDVNPGSAASQPNYLVSLGGALYFSASEPTAGLELWRSDGTAAGTTRVTDLRAGAASSGVADLRASGGVLYFAADDGTLGRELYRSDGTGAGTSLVADLSAGAPASDPHYLTDVGGTLYFTADVPGQGRELWTVAGAAGTPTLLADVGPGAASGVPDTVFPPVAFGGQVYFAGVDAGGTMLWRTDGSTAGTGAFLDTAARPERVAGGKLYLTHTDAAHGTELWTTDGTAAGTRLLRDVNPGPASGPRTTVAGWSAVSGDKFVFSADDGVHGAELWTSDGTPAGTRLVKDVNSTPVSLAPRTLTPFRSALYFTTDAGGLYRGDGTPGGAVRLSSVTPSLFAATADWLYFTTGAGTDAPALWRTDGTPNGTALVRDFPMPKGYGGSILNAFAWKGRVYFSGVGTPGQANTLWTSDGTAAGTRVVRDTGGPGVPQGYHVVADRLYFVAQNGGYEGYLWVTDGTAGGTYTVGGPSVGSLASSQSAGFTDLEDINGLVVFPAQNGTVGREIFRSNGTAAGTQLIKDTDGTQYNGVQLDPRDASRSVGVLGGAAFFFGPGGLWKTDGTTAGTALLKATDGDFYPMFGMTRVGNKLFFFDQHVGEQEFDLWATDGTAAGTRLIKRFDTDRTQYQPLPIGNIVDVGGVAYFSARSTVGGIGTELWRSDGTAAGTMPVADVNPGAGSSDPAHLTVVDGTLYATANDGSHGVQVWKFTPPAVPPVPGEIAAVAVSPFRVRVTWADDAADESGFRVERSTSATFATIDDAFTVAPGATSFTDPVALPGTTYYYRVVAFNGAGQSTSAGVRADTPQVTRTPGVQQVSQFGVLADNTFGWRGQLYFSALSYEAEQYYAQRTDGEVTEFAPLSPMNNPIVLGDRLYYLAFQGDHGELWTTDGTIGNTTLVKTLQSGQARRLMLFNGKLYFAAPDSPSGIWTSDGTEAGTVPVPAVTDKRLAVLADWMVNAPWSVDLDVAMLGNDLYYTADAGNGHGLQLFKTDGVATVQLTDYHHLSGDFTFAPGSLVAAYGSVYFYAQQVSPLTDTYRALWRTNGTPGGTVQVKVLDGLRRYQDPLPIVPTNGTLFFVDNGRLWASDGTSAGTKVLKEFERGTDPALSDLTAVGSRVYFGYHLWTGYDDAQHALYRGQLWSSDGTAAGTVEVPVLPATESLRTVSPYSLTNVDGVLYFAAHTQPNTPIGGYMFRYTPPAVFPAKPSAPTNFAATADNATQVTLTWDDVATNEEGYRLERTRGADFSSVESVITLQPNTTYYVDRGLTAGVTYYYRLVAYNTGGTSAAVSTAPTTTPAGPAAPANLTAVEAVPGERVDLNWADNATTEAGYVVQRSTSPDFFPATTITLSVTLPANATSYSDASVSRLTTYYYSVFAVGAGGNSGAAAASTTTTESKPAAPSNLRTVGVSSTQIDLEWADNSPNEGAVNGFQVERAQGNGPFAPIADLPANSTSYGDTSLQPGRFYRYRVRAANGVGASAFVTSAEVRTLPPSLATPVTVRPALPDNADFLDADPTAVVRVNGVGYFVATDRGRDPAQLELWRTDGTSAGTSMVRIIGFGDLVTLGAAGDRLFFVVTSFTGQTSLWTSNGTPGGTATIAALYTVDLGSAARPSVRDFADVDGTFYFNVLQPNVDDGGTLWKSDGTSGGTGAVKTFPTAWPRGFVAHDHALYFDAGGKYRSDGTPAGTLPSADFVPGWSAYERVTAGSRTYFANDAGLFVNDGTPGGDTLLADSSSGRPVRLQLAGGRLFYVVQQRDVTAPAGYAEVWVSDGTPGGATRVKRFDFGGAPGITAAHAAGGALYFVFVGDNGSEIWRSDGSAAGTRRVTTATHGGVTNLGDVGGLLTFTGGWPTQLWATDGTDEGTVRVSRIGVVTRPAHPDFLTPVGDDLYFVSSPLDSSEFAEYSGGRELWKSNGAAGGLTRLYTGRMVRDLTNVNGTLYFIDGAAIWKTDGTVAGTLRVVDLLQPDARLIAALGDTLFFGSGSDPFGGNALQLWKSDGTAAGTARVGTAAAYVNVNDGVPRPVAVSGKWLYFLDGFNGGAAHGGGLLRTDGTTTERIAGAGDVESLADVDGAVFAVGRLDGRNAYSLVKVDSAGPAVATLVRDLFDYVNHPMPVEHLTKVGHQLFFSAVDGANGWVVWKSDGTTAGTVPVFDPVVSEGFLNAASGRAYRIADVGGVAYVLSADVFDGAGGTAGWLWRTDGTAAGTVRIRAVSVPDVIPYGARPVFATAVDGKFVYSDSDHLWRSDGTFEGTVQVDRIGTADDGARSSAVFGGAAYAVVGDRIYFSGAVNGGGRELRVASLHRPDAPDGLDVVEEPAAGATQAAVPTAAAAAAGGTRLTWRDRSDDESGFMIERSTSPDFATVDATFFAPPGATSYLDTTAAAGVRYYYRVRAVNAGGESAASNLTTTGAPTVLDASFDYAATGQTVKLRLTADVSAALAAALASGGGLTLTNSTTGAAVPTGAFTVTFDRAENSVTLTFASRLADGDYRLRLSAADVRSSSGAALDGNGDGTAGDDFTFDFFVLACDADRDRKVGFTDLLALAKNYGKAGTWAQGDFTGDGKVDFADLLTLAKNYNKAIPAAGAATLASAVDAGALAAAMGIAIPTAPTPGKAPQAIIAKPTPVPKPVTPTPNVVNATTASVLLGDDEKSRPVFSTTRVATPAPAKPKAVARPL